jgi:hypothetical protein
LKFEENGQIVTFSIIGQNVVWTKRGLDKSLLFQLLDKTWGSERTERRNTYIYIMPNWSPFQMFFEEKMHVIVMCRKTPIMQCTAWWNEMSNN